MDKIDIIKKLDSVGGIDRGLFCDEATQNRTESFLNIEARFNAKIPASYKDFYNEIGPFSFLELVCAKCIDANKFMLDGKKVSVGNFYCVAGSSNSSIDYVFSTFKEQLPSGLLPICDGELGDFICINLTELDYGSVYYFHHESQPGDDLFLVAKSFEDFIMSLEIYEETENTDDILKEMKMELSPQMIALLKKSGYGLKE